MRGVMKRISSLFVFFVMSVGVIVTIPHLAHAALIEGDNASKIDNIPQNEPKDVLVGALNAVYTIVGAIAIVVIVGAGILYTISEGDAKKTQTAKDAILYSVIGLVVVGTAFIITGVVQNIGAEKAPAPSSSTDTYRIKESLT